MSRWFGIALVGLGCNGTDETPYSQIESPCEGQSRGTLVEVVPLSSFSTTDLNEYFAAWLGGYMAYGYVADAGDPGIVNGADTYIVKYCTADYDGTPILASGLLGVPQTDGAVDTVVYSHGTAVTRTDTPTNPNVDQTFDGPTPMAVFTGGGMLYLAADGTGFGASEAPRHRYHHAQTEAASTLDLLRAAESVDEYTSRASGRVFDFGYSQGGHSALAFLAAAEADGREITATVAGGAVADPEAWFEWLVAQPDSPYLQLYAAYLVVTYGDVYGVYGERADAFFPPYDLDIDELFDMTHTYYEVVSGLPGNAHELFTSELLAAAADAGSPLRTRLAENSVLGVCAGGPIRLYHSVDDGEVPSALGDASLAALDGCNDVERVDMSGDHLNAWHELLPIARDWFASL